MTNAVLDVLADRIQNRPSDGIRMVLIIEGGGSRAAYSTGMIGAIQELGLTECFDAVYGSSAGALNGAWLLCGRTPDAMRAWTDPLLMRKVMNARRALRGRPVVDLHYLVNVLYTDIVPIDFEAVLANPVTLHPLGTDCADGSAVDLAPMIHDVPTLKRALQATSCLPVMAGPPVEFAGRRYLDAGVAEPIPVHAALAGGATHLVVVRTRRADEQVESPGALAGRITSRWFRRHAPGALPAWDSRPQRRIRDEELLGSLDSVMQIRPPFGAPPVSRIATESALLGTAVALGRDAALAALQPVLTAR